MNQNIRLWQGRQIVFAAIMVYFFGACSKQGLPPTETTEWKAVQNLIPIGPGPILVAWGKGPDIPADPALPAAVGREFPYSFAIGGKGYLGGGTTTDINNQSEYYHDLWEYDTATRAWTQKASMPAGSDIYFGAASFVIGGMGYLCTGGIASQVHFTSKQTWQYNPNSNGWTRKADYAGGFRKHAVGVAINGNGYVGTGLSEAFAPMRDWWEYIPATDQWISKKNFPGGSRFGAVGFISSPDVDGKAYLCSGYDLFQFYNDLWEFDPVTGNWQRKADMPGAARYFAVGISMPAKRFGFVATGTNGSGVFQTFNDCRVYNTATDVWGTEPNIPGVRYGAAGFAIGGIIYIGGGASLNGYPDRSDFWGLRLP